jgi:hypothetical protein
MLAGVAAAMGVSAWLAGESTAGSAVAALMDGAAEASWLETAGPMLTLLSPVLRLDPWLDAAAGAPAAVAVVKAPGSLVAAAAAWCSSVAS